MAITTIDIKAQLNIVKTNLKKMIKVALTGKGGQEAEGGEGGPTRKGQKKGIGVAGKIAGVVGLIWALVKTAQPLVDFVKLGIAILVLIIVKIIKLTGLTLVQLWEWAKEFGAWLKSKIPVLVEFLKTMLTEAKKFFKNPIATVKEWIKKLWNLLTEKFPILKKIEEAAKFIFNVIDNIKTEFLNFIKNPFGTLMVWGERLWDTLSQKFPILKEIKENILDPLYREIKSFFNKPFETIERWLGAISDWLSVTLPTLFENIITWLKDLPGKIGSAIGNAIKNITDKPKEAARAALDTVSPALTTNPVLNIATRVIKAVTAANTAVEKSQTLVGRGSNFPPPVYKTFNFNGVTPESMIDTMRREFGVGGFLSSRF